MSLTNRRTEDKRSWWAGLPWRPVAVGYGSIVCKSWLCMLDDKWWVLQGGLYRTDLEFMRERVRGGFCSEDEALAIAWRWAGVTPDRNEYPPLWAARALDFYVRGWDAKLRE
jgi:hypothetical protein